MDWVSFLKTLFMFWCACVLGWVCAATVDVWRSKDNTKESVLALYHVCPRGQTQAIRLRQQTPLPAEPSCHPWTQFSYWKTYLSLTHSVPSSSYISTFASGLVLAITLDFHIPASLSRSEPLLSPLCCGLTTNLLPWIVPLGRIAMGGSYGS